MTLLFEDLRLRHNSADGRRFPRHAGNFEAISSLAKTLTFFNRPASWGCGLVGVSVAAPNEKENQPRTC
jgi:hypothetical protein